MGSVVSDVIVCRPSDGLVVIGTHGNGIYSTNITNINQLITGAQFYANTQNQEVKCYPNPSHQFASLEFTLKQNSNIEIILLDELGKQVKSIATKKMDAGTYTESIDGKGLAPGVYYVSLKVNETKTTRIIVLE